MAITFTVSATTSWSNGNKREIVGSLATSGTYTGSGGDSLTASAFGLAVIDRLTCSPKDGYSFDYDHTNAKLVIYGPGGQAAHTHDLKIIGSQAAASTDAVSAKTLTLGKEAATDITIAGANSATLGGVVASTASIAAAPEIANGTSLTITGIRFTAIGY